MAGKKVQVTVFGYDAAYSPGGTHSAAFYFFKAVAAGDKLI